MSLGISVDLSVVAGFEVAVASGIPIRHFPKSIYGMRNIRKEGLGNSAAARSCLE